MERNYLSLLLAIGSFAAVSLLIYVTGNITLFWSFYFIPIMIAALYYEVVGSIIAGITGFAAIILWIYLSMRYLTDPLEIMANTFGILIGTLIFVSIGIVLGFLSSKRKQDTETLQRLTMVDRLTGLHNYGYFMERLEEERQRADRFGSKLSLIMLDIDHFKPYNDKFGHQKGNALLKKVANILTRQVRTIDIVARYGGEEFAILLPNTSREAVEIAERIRRAVETAKFEGGKGEAFVKRTLSAGVATYPTDASNEIELIDRADQALYVAKEQGRNAVRVYSPNLAKVSS